MVQDFVHPQCAMGGKARGKHRMWVLVDPDLMSNFGSKGASSEHLFGFASSSRALPVPVGFCMVAVGYCQFQ